MTTLLALVATVLLLVAFALFLVAAQRLYRRLQRALVMRGYRSPVALALGGTASFVLTLGIFGLVAAVVGAEDALPAIFPIALLVPLALAAGVRLLPARPTRVVGARVVRFPYRRASRVLFVCAAGLAVSAVVLQRGPLGSLAALLTVAGLTCREIARRSALPEASSVLASDARAPVLYLRPFQRDEDIFVEVSRTSRQFWTDWARNIARTSSRRHLTLEAYLKDEITSIGPWIGLGNPLDFLPPEGAARSYVADDDWQRHFRELARTAVCSVMVAGVSSQVRWEMATLRELGLHQRLFVLTPPLPTPKSGLAGFLTKPPRMRRMPPVSWPEVASALREAGYHPDIEAPGPGAAIGFDDGGKAIVLVRGTSSAAIVVAAIARALSALPSTAVARL